MLVVQRLARVLLQMQARDADLARLAALQLDRDLAFAHDRVRVLADLIPGRKIGVEVVLAVETAHDVDVRVEPEAGAHRLRDAFAVDDRQHARKRRVDEAHLRVRLGAEIGRGAAEQFGAADDLGVDFEADHDLPRAALALDRVGHRLSLRHGWRDAR